MGLEQYRKNIEYIQKYRKASNAATGSKFDANANVENKNITTMMGELPKEDIIGTNRLLMYDKITEIFDNYLAQNYLEQLNEHLIYKHDCGSFINLVFAVAAQFAGAVSTPEFLTYMDYFIRREYGDEYYKHTKKVVDLSKRGRTLDDVITGYWQQIIYSINQPAAARNYQSVNECAYVQ